MWIAHAAASRTHRPSRSTRHTHTLLSENVYEGRSGKDVGFSKRTWDREASELSQYCNESHSIYSTLFSTSYSVFR